MVEALCQFYESLGSFMLDGGVTGEETRCKKGGPCLYVGSQDLCLRNPDNRIKGILKSFDDMKRRKLARSAFMPGVDAL